MKKLLLKTMLLLCALVAGTSMSWADTKTEGFENGSASSNYQGTVTVSEAQSDCGISWEIYYGCVSTNNALTGSKSAQMRWYSSSKTKYGYITNKTAVDGLTNVAFNAKVSNKNLKMEVSYSSDGSNWTVKETTTFSGTTKTACSYDIPAGNKYIKIGVSSTGTAPSSGNYSLIIDDVVFTYTAGSKVSTPTFTPGAGAVAYGTGVTINCGTNDAIIHYTIDGTEPTTSSATYSSALTINSATTIKALAVKDGLTNSDVATAEYTIAPPSAPTFNVAEGEVTAGTTVTITGTGTIRYTTDGVAPTSSTGTVYSEPVSIDASCTLKAICVDGGGNASDVTSATYTVLTPVAGYTIDFESQLSQYTDWTVTNAEVATNGDNANISAHGGTHYGTTGGKASASIQTKNKVANPETFTCYVSKQSTNTSESTWVIQVSENGSTWTDVKTQDATSMSKGSWVEFTADLTSYSDVYVRLYYNGSTAVRNVDDIVLTEATPSSVATPTFSVATGTYTEIKTVEISCATAGATIYYTLDGSTPTSSNTPYTGALTIDATTTVKAIAIKDAESSSVASATYTIELPLTTIAEVKELSSGDTFSLNLTGAQIVYFDGSKNMYIRDASGAILFYNSSSFSTTLVTGDILSGIVTGKYQPYNGLPEVTNSDISGLSKTSNSTVVAKSIAGTTAAIEANLCDLVKIENTEISESDSKYYVGESSDIRLYDNFKVGYTPETGKAVDVSGIATVYSSVYQIYPRFESDIVYLSSAEEVAIGAAGIATFCSEHALDFTGTDAIAVYTAAASGNRVILTQIHKVPANTGVILMNALGMNEGAVAAVNVPYLDDDADDVSGNELVGITARTQVDAMSGGKYNYILSNEDEGIGFYAATNGNYLAANKAYLSTANPASVRGFLGFTDDSDAINEIVNGKSVNGTYYDLSGRRVSKATKGIYIVNGKKVVK